MKNQTMVVWAFLACGACEKKDSEGARGTQTAPVAAPAPANPAMPAVAAPPGVDPRMVQAARDLTDDKVTRYIAYMKAMSANSQQVVSVGTSALAKSKGDKDKFAKEVQKDPGMGGIAAAHQAALAKSGLSQEDLSPLTHLCGEYYRGARSNPVLADTLAETRKKIADAKAKGKQPNQFDLTMEKNFSEQIAKDEVKAAAFKKTFAANYGQQAADILDRHAGEYHAVAMEMAKGILGPSKRPAAKH